MYGFMRYLSIAFQMGFKERIVMIGMKLTLGGNGIYSVESRQIFQEQ